MRTEFSVVFLETGAEAMAFVCVGVICDVVGVRYSLSCAEYMVMQ